MLQSIIRRSIICLICYVAPILASAQTLFQGQVTDAQNPTLPLVGAVIRLPDDKQGTITDSSGQFSIRSVLPVRFIRVSYLGYRTQTVVLQADQPVVSVALVPEDGKQLTEVTVSSKYYKQYATSTISSVLRLQTPLLNLSQSIQTITPAIIYDQASFNMTEGVSRNISGVVRQEVSNNLGPNIFMRGGQISTLRNGIDLTPLYRGPAPEDAAIIDQVEFIKGPSLFMNNIGDPAGSFNVVTKQPTGARRNTLQALFGSFNLYRLAADFDGQLDKKNKLQYRLNGMAMTTNSFVKYDFNQRFLLAPVLKYVLSPRTSISAEYVFQRFRYGMHSPIVMTPNGFASLPIDFTITEKNLNPYQVSDHTGFLTLSHQISDRWQFRARGAFMRNDNEGTYLWVTGINTASPNVLLRNPKYDLTRALVFSQQAFLNGRVRTGNVQHQMLAGADINQKTLLANNYVEYDTYRATDGTTKLTYYPLDITSSLYETRIPAYRAPDGLATRNTTQRIRYASFYALDEVGLFRNTLRLTLGARYTAIRTHNEVLGVTTSSRNGVLTPRLGISYTIRPDMSVYALYDRTFVPQVGLTSSGQAITPRSGVNQEVGLKKNWSGGRWNTTLAVYRLNRNGLVSPDPTNTLYRIQVGQTSAQGVELDLIGQVVNGLNVVVNYAYNDATIDQDVNAALVGTPTPMYVKHIQNTWLNYELPTKSIPGVSLSLGYQYQGGRGERYATTSQHVIPDFFRLDGGVGWQRKAFKINLLINNLLNKTLIATAWYRNSLYYWVPQPPVSGRLSLSYTF